MGRVLLSDIVPRSVPTGPCGPNADTRLHTLHVGCDVHREDTARVVWRPPAVVLSVYKELLVAESK